MCTREAFGQTLTVRPAICPAPCEVRLELRIERAPENRWWSITYAGPEVGSSGGTLDGENSEGVLPVCTTNLRPCFRTLRSEGTYLFVGCVHKNVEGKIKPLCTERKVQVGESWMPPMSVSSARAPSVPTNMSASGSAASSERKSFIGTSAVNVRRFSCRASKDSSAVCPHSTHLERSDYERQNR